MRRQEVTVSRTTTKERNSEQVRIQQSSLVFDLCPCLLCRGPDLHLLIYSSDTQLEPIPGGETLGYAMVRSPVHHGSNHLGSDSELQPVQNLVCPAIPNLPERSVDHSCRRLIDSRWFYLRPVCVKCARSSCLCVCVLSGTPPQSKGCAGILLYRDGAEESVCDRLFDRLFDRPRLFL